MFASLRAELLILRKSRVAWALVLTAPLLTLVTTYLFQFLDYLGLTPVMYAKFGTPTQDLPALLPSQFAIQAGRLSPAGTGDGEPSGRRCCRGRAGLAYSPGRRSPS